MIPRIVLLPFLVMLAANAQTGTSALTGVIRDATGAPIPGVALKLINEESGVAISGETNFVGLYRVASLPPGRYRLEADLAGFQRVSRGNITLAVSQVLSLDLTLEIGEHSEVVNVEAAAPITDSQSSSVGHWIDRSAVANLPLPNRAATSAVALAPGVVMIDPGSGAENYPVFSVAGGRSRNQNFTLDGGNVSNAVGLTRPQQLTSLPVDAMQEFRVLSNNYSAEYGHSTGGIVTLSTRSGTNEFHGSLFEYFRNDALDARNFFASQKPPLRHNQFGVSFGGPILHDRTHFFVSWERTQELSSLALLQTVPSLAERGGDFSALRNTAGNPIIIYDPATGTGAARQPFSNNQIPQSRFDPVSRAVLAWWPAPNRAGTATGANNYLANSNSRLDRDIVVGRVDHQLRPQDQLTARYYINNSSTENLGSFGLPQSDPNADATQVRVQSILGSYTHIFRANLINELRVTYLRRKFIDLRYGYQQDLAASLGLTGVSGSAFPTFTLPGYATLGGNPARIQTPITDTQFLESVTYTHGTHAAKFGVEHRNGYNREQRDRSSSGSFTITPLITSLPGKSGTGDAFATFLLGDVNSASVASSDVIPSRASYSGLYAQDDWRITHSLTLNLGLRWEVEIPRNVDHNRMNSFDPNAINPVSNTPGVVTFAGLNGMPNQAFHTDWNNFGPRLGFAWNLERIHTVIRGGGGIFYGPSVSATIGDAATTGFSNAATLVVPQPDTLSALRLRDGFPALVRPPLTPAFGAVTAGQLPNTAVSYFAPNRPSPVSYQYNLNIQHELAHGILIEAGYLANISHHLTTDDLTINQVPSALIGPGNAQALRPFPQFSNVTLINPAIGNSTYHAGYIKTERRFASGFSFLAHYTWSKFIDDAATPDDYGVAGSYVDAYNRRLDKGLSGDDVPHRAIFSGLYEVRAFKSKRLLSAVLSGWSVGPLVTLQSGPTFTVVTASNTTNAFSAGPLRPDLIGDPNSGPHSVNRWFNTAAFSAPAPYRFGNSPRSVLRGAPLRAVDLTAAKQFVLTERFHADLRGEFYNLLNHANFNIPGTTLGAADFGVVSSARAARTVQLGLRVSF